MTHIFSIKRTKQAFHFFLISYMNLTNSIRTARNTDKMSIKDCIVHYLFIWIQATVAFVIFNIMFPPVLAVFFLILLFSLSYVFHNIFGTTEVDILHRELVQVENLIQISHTYHPINDNLSRIFIIS